MKPSIVVLPLTTMSGDHAKEDFADSMVEPIIHLSAVSADTCFWPTVALDRQHGNTGCRRSKRRRVEHRSCQRTVAAFRNTYRTGKLGSWWHGAKPRNWRRPSAWCSSIPRLRVYWASVPTTGGGTFLVGRGVAKPGWFARECAPGSISGRFRICLPSLAKNVAQFAYIDPRVCQRSSLSSIGAGAPLEPKPASIEFGAAPCLGAACEG